MHVSQLMNHCIYEVRRRIQRCKAGLPLGQFVIIARSRTGSNLLASLLNAHPDVTVHWEVFQKVENTTCKHIYDKMVQNSRGCMQMGFKLFYYHPIGSDDKSIWDMLGANRKIKIIHLTRNNLLRVHISRLIAGRTNEWLAESQSKLRSPGKAVHVDVTRMLSDFCQTRAHINDVQQRFRNHELFDVTYEELTTRQQSVVDAVFNFLRVPALKVQSRLMRQNPEPISALVSNYAEVKQALEGTTDKHMLTA